MDAKLKDVQTQVLRIVAGVKKQPFALTGGTALERYYLKHRFSRDLDFFTRRFDKREISAIIRALGKQMGVPVTKHVEFVAPQHARVVMYLVKAGGLDKPLRIDFVEEVLIDAPRIKVINGLPVYHPEEIYYHKIFTITGTGVMTDITGRETGSGRNEPRDAVDIYYLSRKVKPLHEFLNEVPRIQQRMFIRWVNTYSRLDMKLGVLELEMQDRSFDIKDMIEHIDSEVAAFAKGIA